MSSEPYRFGPQHLAAVDGVRQNDPAPNLLIGARVSQLRHPHAHRAHLPKGFAAIGLLPGPSPGRETPATLP